MATQLIIADDHTVLRHCLASALSSEPSMRVVGEADDGREAVRLTRRHSPDVVLMDIGMPRLNGIEATRQIVADGLGARVVALTMYREISYVQQMLQAGALGYALKTNPMGELVEAIRQAASGKCYLAPEVANLVVDTYRQGGPGGNGNGQGNGHSNGNGVLQSIGVLSSREREVLQMVAEGHASKTIAANLCLSVKTIETHRQRLMNKLNIHSIAELTKFAIREGLTTLELTES